MRSKKNKDSAESDPKANGSQDELFEIRSSRRHSDTVVGGFSLDEGSGRAD